MTVHLHSWLRRVPMPASLRLDGKKTVIVGDGKSRWRDAINAIEQLGASQVECLNAEGNVLRVTQLDTEKEDDDAPKRPTHNAELAQLAEVVMEAGDRGARRHAEAYELSFAKMTELVQILVDRLTGVESAWQATLAAQGSGEDKDEAGGMVGSLIQLATAREQAKAAAESVKKAAAAVSASKEKTKGGKKS